MKASWEGVLREVGRHQTTTIRRVAEATGLTPAAARNVVLALERRGLVERLAWTYDPDSGFKRWAIGASDQGRRELRRRRLRRRAVRLAA